MQRLRARAALVNILRTHVYSYVYVCIYACMYARMYVCAYEYVSQDSGNKWH